MKSASFLAGFVLIACTAAVAWGQYGLYGSPGMLRLPAEEPKVVLPVGYPTTPAPVIPAPLGANPTFPVRSLASAVDNTFLPPAPPVADGPGGGFQPAGAPSVMHQMLQESQRGGPDTSCLTDGGCGGCGDAVGQSQCADCLPCEPSCEPSVWFGGVSGLLMTRDKANRVWTTYETNNNPNQLMNSEDASVNWQGGGQVTFGRWFCSNDCRGRWGVAATYWGLAEFDATASASVAGGSVSTPLIVSDIEFAGINGTQYFDSAQQHRLWRRDRFQNIEVNLIRNQMLGMPVGMAGFGPGGQMNINWLAGVRFFRFDDGLTFGSLDLGYSWGEDGGVHEAYLRDAIKNNLLGFQIGANAYWQFAPQWQLFVGPRFGIYNNHIRNDFQAFRGDGVVATPTAGSGVTGSYPVRASKDVVAFMGQIDLGLRCQFAPNWGGQVGYRVMAITGVGLADNQIPTYVVDIPEIADIDTNGDLVLHGVFAGIWCNF